jgi:acylphosphatase
VSESEKICIHCYVTGRVQGVWYRSSAQKEAQKLGLTGWAKNLDDGRVEMIICGKAEHVKKFVKWLWQGPTLASVTDVDGEQVAWEEHKSFEVL